MQSMNLLPYEFRTRIVFRQRLHQWVVVWCVCGAIAGIFGAWKMAELKEKKDELATLQEHCRPYREMVKKNAEFRKRLSEVSGRQKLLSELENGQYPLRLIGLISQGAAETDERLQVQIFSMRRVFLKQEPLVTAGDKARPNSRKKPKDQEPIVEEHIELTLSGIAADDLSVAQFIVLLRESGVFDSVELKSSLNTSLAFGDARKYLIECLL